MSVELSLQTCVMWYEGMKGDWVTYQSSSNFFHTNHHLNNLWHLQLCHQNNNHCISISVQQLKRAVYSMWSGGDFSSVQRPCYSHFSSHHSLCLTLQLTQSSVSHTSTHTIPLWFTLPLTPFPCDSHFNSHHSPVIHTSTHTIPCDSHFHSHNPLCLTLQLTQSSVFHTLTHTIPCASYFNSHHSILFTLQVKYMRVISCLVDIHSR